MSLYKKLILIITIFLFLIAGLTLFYVVKYNKNLLEKQLQVGAKNSAVLISFALSKNIDFQDGVSINGIIKGIVSNGFFEKIIVLNNSNKIISNISHKEEKSVPKIFEKMVQVNKIGASSNIVNSDWRNIGRVEVYISKMYAINELWKSAKNIFMIFLVFGILLLLVLYYIINILLKPFKKLKKQVAAIDDNEFIMEKRLPDTTEFREVVIAINKIIYKLKVLFNKEIVALNKYNKLIYMDQNTKLYNRNHLILALENYLNVAKGVLVFLEIKDEIGLKRSIGFEKFFEFQNFLVSKFKKDFSFNSHIVIARTNEKTYMVLIPFYGIKEIYLMIEKFYNEIEKHVEYAQLDKRFNVSFAVGISEYKKNDTIHNVLAIADDALQNAFLLSNKKIYYSTKEDTFEKIDKHLLMEYCVRKKTIKINKKNIYHFDGELFFKEYNIIIKDKNNKEYNSIEILQTSNKTDQLLMFEKFLLKNAFDEALANKEKIIIKISLEFIKNSFTFKWLIKELRTTYLNCMFIFEFSSKSIILNKEEFKIFVKFLHGSDHRISIQRFVLENEGLDFLKDIRPYYVKISKLYLLRNESQITEEILKNVSSILNTHLLVKNISTNEEYDRIKEIKIDLLQGSYLDKNINLIRKF